MIAINDVYEVRVAIQTLNMLWLDYGKRFKITNSYSSPLFMEIKIENFPNLEIVAKKDIENSCTLVNTTYAKSGQPIVPNTPGSQGFTAYNPSIGLKEVYEVTIGFSTSSNYVCLKGSRFTIKRIELSLRTVDVEFENATLVTPWVPISYEDISRYCVLVGTPVNNSSIFSIPNPNSTDDDNFAKEYYGKFDAIKTPKCECGSSAVGSAKHSHWCPLVHLESH